MECLLLLLSYTRQCVTKVVSVCESYCERLRGKWRERMIKNEHCPLAEDDWEAPQK
uniref:Uncharacterized protein n=1 Tax=Anguilla anguilla TaxID=7936 RepID=A0A0E9XB03_ANGAN